MSLKQELFLLIVCGLALSDCFDEEWSLYENSFKNAYREEIYVANATVDTNFKSNYTVDQWKTLTVGRTCYTGGITNDSMLVILFSTLSEDGSGMVITPKILDLEVPALDFEYFHKRKNGKDKIMLVTYMKNKQEFVWYTLDHYFLNKTWSWTLGKNVSHFKIVKMDHKNMLLTITTNDLGINSADIYTFTTDPMNLWFFQSIPLTTAANSSCINSIDSTFYLSIPQPTLDQLQIYQTIDNIFVPYENISSPKIDQVVCFENGFKSFIAFNGLNAGIYEFTEDGLTKERIVNSNLKGIQFWLPIPVNTYRDETILLCQRQLDHGTHLSFDVDVVTYNGNRFEEHEDIPCLLFGEQQHGLKCLTEYDPKTGIWGTSYIAISNHLGLIVPRTNDTSLLFNLKIGMRSVAHPAKKDLDTYLELKERLQAMMETQNMEQAALIKQTNNKTNQINIVNENPDPESSNFLLRANLDNNTNIFKLRDEIEKVERDIDGLSKKVAEQSQFKPKDNRFTTIIFNGPVDIAGELQSEKTNSNFLGGEEADNLLHDIVRKSQLKPITGHKTFNDLTVEEITFENVNGIGSNSFVVNNNEIIEVNGNITFENLVNAENVITTSSLVNEVNIDKEWVNLDKTLQGPVEFEHIRARNTFNTTLLNEQNLSINSVDSSSSVKTFNGEEPHKSLFIPGNVTVTNINGQNFESLLKKLCLKNIKCQIASLIVKGDINIRGDIQANYLNNLRFPEEYVSLDSNEKLLSITGFKEFTNITRGFKVSTDNKVNGIDLSKIITRSEEQNISGNITFEDLEVDTILDVDGIVKGDGMENFVPNMGLKETHVIKSNVNFLNLEVLGNIFIDNLNGTDFYRYLDDIIFNDEQNVTITGNKSFPESFTVLKNLHIDSNMINNISLDSIINKDSSEELQIDTILGTVDFEHLYVKGEFDEENINELNESIVRVGENQTLTSEIVFVEPLYVEKLVFEELNNLDQQVEENNNKSDLFDDKETIFNNLNVDVLVVEGNVIGDVDGFDLKDLKENYLSYTKNQNIYKPYFIHKLTLNNLTSKNINDIPSESVFSYEKFKANITDILSYRKPTVEEMNVEGITNIKMVNNKSFDDLIQNDVWMKMYDNETSKILTVDGDVYFETLEIQNLAGANFNEYFSNLVFKNETYVEIEKVIVFENGIKVKKLFETQTLNGIELDNILRKDGKQTLMGPINILGNASVKDDLNVKGMLNNVDVENIFDQFIIGDNITTVKGEVMFQRLPYIHELVINGSVNGKDFEDLKTQFVYINDDIDLQKQTIFNETVCIHGNLGITKDINDVILSDFASRVAWITQDTDIQGPVRFTCSVESLKYLNVEEELNTKLLFGKQLEEYVNNGVFVNRGFQKGLFKFENIAIHDILNTKFINNLNINNIIPLKTEQEIESLDIGEMILIHDVPVKNKVNGVKLIEELNRTLLNNIEQVIPAEVVFLNNVIVENIISAPKINNKPSLKIVTTNTDQDLSAPYNFNTKCWLDNHLIVDGFVNGINLTTWKNSAVLTNLDEPQNIGQQWTVVKNLNLVGPVNGDGIMNGMNLTDLVNDVKEKENYMYETKDGIINDYKNLCTDVTYMYENAKKQIYKLKYFEELQQISLPNYIHYVKYFEHQERHYLLINEHQNCLSHLMEFYDNGFYLVRQVNTGIISQVIVVRYKDDLFLITRGEDGDETTCQIRFSTVVFTFVDKDLKLLASIKNQELLQESQIPLTFYGLKHGLVTEFKIDKLSEIIIQEYRNWEVMEDNVAFFPRGFKTGLALRSGKNIIFLNRSDPVVEDDFGIDTEAVIKGTVTKSWNFIVPGRVGGDVTITNVGIKRARKSLLAVASYKKTKVEHRLDIVEIYSNPFTGELFDKIPTYRPSSLTSIEFENGETLLAFMEKKKVLQIYEFKGINGFKHRSSIKIKADQLFLMDLPVGENKTLRKVLGLIYQNKITLLQAVMIGNKMNDDLNCKL